MANKQKAFIFPKLIRGSTMVCRFIRYMNNIEFFYVDLNKSMKNKPSKIKSLENKSMKWIKKEYEFYSEYARGDYLSYTFTDIAQAGLKKSYLIRWVEKHFSLSGSLKRKMDMVWKKNIHLFIEQFAHQYAAAEFLIDKRGYNHATLLCYNSMAHLVKKHVKNRENIKILIAPGFITIDFCLRVLAGFSIAKYFRDIFLKKDTAKINVKAIDPKIDLDIFKIAYFPHKGLFYGDFFAKDHFYSTNKNSPLYKTHILHVSLNEKNEEYIKKSYKFYNANNILYIDTSDLSGSLWHVVRECIMLLFSIPFKILKDLLKFGPDFISMVFLTFFRLKKYQYIFVQLKNLKFALVGYEMLFSRELAMILASLGVKVCATQERFITAFSPEPGMSYFLLDYYFVAGEIIKKKGLKKHYIKHIIPVGLVRVDNLFEYAKKKISDTKYDLIKQSKKLIIALDYSLPKDDIEDVLRQVGKIRQLRQFYLDLIKLSDQFPLLYIAIKGKETESYHSHYIEDIMKAIRSRNNISIEMDLEKYNPSYIIEKADLTIACQTSLCDELLAAGRKVIFYELSDYLETFFNYENLPIIVKNYKQLKHHVENFLNGVYLNESAIKILQEKYYSNCFHGKVQKTVREMLEKIVKDGDLGEHDGKAILNNHHIRKTNEA